MLRSNVREVLTVNLQMASKVGRRTILAFVVKNKLDCQLWLLTLTNQITGILTFCRKKENRKREIKVRVICKAKPA